MSTDVDHVVITADTLSAGAEWCRQTFGVEPAVGGKHSLMGTHNLLMNLSSPRFPRCYLEIIAVDPDAATPSRRRWFDLDDRPAGPPVLHGVVVRSRTLDMHRWGLMHKGVRDPGVLVPLSRGALQWTMLLNAEASMPAPLPLLIQWKQGHPCDALPSSDVALEHLALDGLPAPVAQVLGIRHNAGSHDAAPRLRLNLSSPGGAVSLDRDYG